MPRRGRPGYAREWGDHDDLLAALPARPTRRARDRRGAHPDADGRERRRRGAASRRRAGPGFAPHVGTTQPIGAWTISDPHGSGTSVVVEYEHDDGAAHDMLVEIDGEDAVDLLVGPSGVVDARATAQRRFDIEAVAPDVALGRIAPRCNACSAARMCRSPTRTSSTTRSSPLGSACRSISPNLRRRTMSTSVRCATPIPKATRWRGPRSWRRSHAGLPRVHPAR